MTAKFRNKKPKGLTKPPVSPPPPSPKLAEPIEHLRRVLDVQAKEISDLKEKVDDLGEIIDSLEMRVDRLDLRVG